MPDRVVVFIDYQNLYMRARGCFHQPTDRSIHGHVDPIALGEHLTRDSPFDREFVQVRLYRGLPDSSKDPRGFAACMRQSAHWEADPRAITVLRPLAYPRGWPDRSPVGERPREKGIDVALAVDFVTMAIEDRYDVGILVSTDADLVPALEFVASRMARTNRRAEVAALRGRNRYTKRLSVPGRQLWCHWVTHDIYNGVADPINYGS